MSLYDYEESKKIEMENYSFYGLLMALMRKADTPNLEVLKAYFPETWKELQARYNALCGKLEGDE